MLCLEFFFIYTNLKKNVLHTIELLMFIFYIKIEY